MYVKLNLYCVEMEGLLYLEDIPQPLCLAHNFKSVKVVLVSKITEAMKQLCA